MASSIVVRRSKESLSGGAAALLAAMVAAASGCATETDASLMTRVDRLQSTRTLLPVRDVFSRGVNATDRTNLYANLDDGVAFGAADDAATEIHNVRRRDNATYTAGFDATPAGMSAVTMSFRAMSDAPSGGTVRAVLLAGTDVVATGPVHELDGAWQNVTDTFSDLSVASTSELRAQLFIGRHGTTGVTRVTQLWLSVTSDDGAPSASPAPSSPAPAPSPSPSPSPAPAPTGTCGLSSDRNVHDVPYLAKPGYLETAIDPTFGTRITRITGDPGTTVPRVGGTWGDRERHHYSKDQAWNADMSLLYLEERSGGPQLFLDGHTYEVLFSYVEESADAARWHPTDPNVMIYVGDHDVRELDVRSGARTTVATFSGYSDFSIGMAEGNLSADGRLVAVYATDPNGGRVTFAYDLVAKKKYPDIHLQGVGEGSSTMSPKGDYIVVGNIDETTSIYDLQGNLVSQWNEVGLPDHYDVAIDADGSEIAVGSARTATYAGQIVKMRIPDGAPTLLSFGGYGSHTSTRNYRRPGWAYSSFFESDNYPPYSREIVIVKLDGSGVAHRIAHHRSTEDAHDYYAEAHPSPSPDGSKVIFASDWGDPNGPIQAYVVDLPDVASGSCE